MKEEVNEVMKSELNDSLLTLTSKNVSSRRGMCLVCCTRSMPRCGPWKFWNTIKRFLREFILNARTTSKAMSYLQQYCLHLHLASWKWSDIRATYTISIQQMVGLGLTNDTATRQVTLSITDSISVMVEKNNEPFEKKEKQSVNTCEVHFQNS